MCHKTFIKEIYTCQLCQQQIRKLYIFYPEASGLKCKGVTFKPTYWARWVVGARNCDNWNKAKADKEQMISYRVSQKSDFYKFSWSSANVQARDNQEKFYKSLFLGHPLFGACEPKQKHRWVEVVQGQIKQHTSSVHQLSSKCCNCRMLKPKSHHGIAQVSTSAMDFQFLIWGIGVAMTNLKWGLCLVGGCGGSLFWNILSSWIL